MNDFKQKLKLILSICELYFYIKVEQIIREIKKAKLRIKVALIKLHVNIMLLKTKIKLYFNLK